MQNFNLSNLLLNLGTLGAIVISYMTILEIQRDREMSMLPDVFISSTNQSYEIRFDQDFHKCPMFSDYKILKQENLYCPIRNLGFGAAKNLVFSWEIDYNNLNDTFASRFGDNYNISLSQSQYSEDFIEKIAVCESDTFVIGMLLERPLDFLAPAISINVTNQLIIPDEIIRFSIYNRLMFSQGHGSQDFKSAVPFKITVTYNNLISKEYKKEYLIRIGGYIDDLNFYCGVNIEELSSP